jgi:hypothetical protein
VVFRLGKKDEIINCKTMMKKEKDIIVMEYNQYQLCVILEIIS